MLVSKRQRPEPETRLRSQIHDRSVVASMLRGDPTRNGLIRGGLLTTVCMMALASWGLGRADALDGALEVRSAYVNLDKGVFLLHARIEYPMGPAIRRALRDGLTLTFELEARVDRERRFWFNLNVVELTLRRELSYHAVSERYVVRDTKSGDQESFATLDEALDYLGKVDAWPILVEPQLDGGNYTLSVLLARKLWRLVRDYRAHVPGSRLTARTVGIFGALVIAPLLIVYLSSLEFINRGIDSWFKVEVKQGLNDALGLSRAALDLRMREYSVRTVALAAALTDAAPAEVQSRLD